MKRLPMVSLLAALVLGLILLWVASPPAKGDYLGAWQIDEYVTITTTTHQFSTGAAYAATGDVTYSIYEDSNNTQLVDVNAMTAFDSVTGLYLGRQQLTAALGFQVDKHYTVLIKATVDGVTAITTHNFQVVPATVGADVLYIKGVDADDVLPGLNDIQDKVEDGIDAKFTGLANWITVFSTDFASDYNETLNMWNTNAEYVLGGGAASTDLLTTTVAVANSTTQFTLTAGPDGNDAYINHSIIVTDANASSYPEVRKIVSYVGATKTVMVDLPFSFTPAAGDVVAIPRAGYAPSGAGWGMLDPRGMFEIVFAKNTTDYNK